MYCCTCHWKKTAKCPLYPLSFSYIIMKLYFLSDHMTIFQPLRLQWLRCNRLHFISKYGVPLLLGGLCISSPSWHQVWSPSGGFYLNTGDISLGQVICLANKLSVEMKYVTFWAEVFKTIMKFYHLFFFCSILSNASERDWGQERRAKADVYMWHEWETNPH